MTMGGNFQKTKMPTIYGIQNCDKVRRARRFLNERNIPHRFVDFKNEPPDVEILRRFIAVFGIENLVNKRGTTYRNLDDADKKSLNIKILQNHPTLIKRPILIVNEKIIVGFDQARWMALF